MANAQRENMEAINAFFRGANAKNAKAGALKDGWIRWYDDLGWYETGNDDNKWVEAKTKRAMFNAANGLTERGMTYEQTMKEEGAVDEAVATVSDTKVNQAPAAKAKAEVGPIRQSPPVTMITLRLGSKGEPVKKWQKAIGEKADGFFGKGTEAKTKAWQKSKGIKPDGVVGPATWAMAFVVKRDASKDPASVSVPSAVHDARGELPSVKTKEAKQTLADKRVAEIEQGTSNPKSRPVSNTSLAKGFATAGIGLIAIGVGVAVVKAVK
jgi:peptidoglycan hydrolase-like protein with peptidoglycan-binding domain